MTGTSRITLYTAPGCHLCEEMLAVVARAQALRAVALTVVDITGDAALEAAYRPDIPVLTIDGRRAFKYRATLAALLEKIDHPASPPGPPGGAVEGEG